MSKISPRLSHIFTKKCRALHFPTIANCLQLTLLALPCKKLFSFVEKYLSTCLIWNLVPASNETSDYSSLPFHVFCFFTFYHIAISYTFEKYLVPASEEKCACSSLPISFYPFLYLLPQQWEYWKSHGDIYILSKYTIWSIMNLNPLVGPLP